MAEDLGYARCLGQYLRLLLVRKHSLCWARLVGSKVSRNVPLKLLQHELLVLSLLEVLAEGRREGLRVVVTTVFVQLDPSWPSLSQRHVCAVAGSHGPGSSCPATQQAAMSLRYERSLQVRMDFHDDVEGRGPRVREHIRCQCL